MSEYSEERSPVTEKSTDPPALRGPAEVGHEAAAVRLLLATPAAHGQRAAVRAAAVPAPGRALAGHGLPTDRRRGVLPAGAAAP